MAKSESGTPVRTAVHDGDLDAEGTADREAAARAASDAKARTKARGSDEMRELIRQNDQRLFDFCSYMLGAEGVGDELLLSIFREFGETYRRHAGRARHSVWNPVEARLTLYQIGWERIRDTLFRFQPTWMAGRDTRSMRSQDEDLLATIRSKKVDPAAFRTQVMERLDRIDPEFRAPLVLRDILGFEDEDAVRILGLRWGVYRHRLHRGRLESKDALRGRAMPTPLRSQE